jgi:hypothetical protein
MKRIILSSLLALILLVAFVPVANADMAMEGSGNYKSVMTSTFKAISAEKERLYMTFEAIGGISEAPADSPLFNATFHALGALEAIKGAYKDSGFIIYYRPNGDKVYATWQASGTMGVKSADRKLTLTFVGGTGECTGIEGGGELTGVGGLYRKLTKKVRVSMSVGKFHWKIPQKKK